MSLSCQQTSHVLKFKNKMMKCRFLRKVLDCRSEILWRTPYQGSQVRWTSTLRRSFLYLSDDKINVEKAAQLSVDCFVLDCENKKDTQNDVRENIKQFLNDSDINRIKSEWCVKVNPVQARELCEADLEAVFSASNLPASICLPKVNNPDQLQWFAERIWNYLIKRPENSRGPIKLLMLIESARAMLNLPELCKKAEELATMAPIFPVGLVLGGFQLIENLGASKTLSGLELLYIREKFVLVAKAFGLQAIDMGCDRKNKTLFKEKCEEGVALGFTGKQVINLSEAVIAQEMFVPSRTKVLWAKTVLRKYYENQGKEELNFENSEVDIATFRRAEHTLKVAIAVGKIKGGLEAVISQGK